MLKSIKSRILAAFMATLLIFIGIGVYQLIILKDQLQTIKIVKNETLQIALKADEMKLSIIQIKEQLADVSATRAENGMDDGLREAVERTKMFKQDINDLIKLKPKEEQRLQDLNLEIDTYYTLGQKMAQAYINEGVKQGNLVMHEFDKSTDNINGKVDRFRTEALANIDNIVDGLEKATQRTLINETFCSDKRIGQFS